MELYRFVFLCCSFTLFNGNGLNAQTITTFAGNGIIGSALGDGGPATAANISFPASGSIDGFGNYYFIQGGRIREVSAIGVINTIVGNGTVGYSGDDGPATAAEFGLSYFKVDSIGNIYIADYVNNRIRKVDIATGIIHTIAGNGTPTHTGDGGPATAATITPGDICLDRYGNMYIEDSARIRKIDATGTITTIAGTGVGGFSGDNGPAIAAEIVASLDMCLDQLGNLYFGDHGGVRIRKIDMSTGVVTSIAGTGTYLYNGDEIPATVAQFKEYGLAFDRIGNLFVVDKGNSRIRMIDTFGIIHTVAGTGINGFSGDNGPATAAQIAESEGIAIDVCGNLFVADWDNNRIRKVTYPPTLTTPVITLSGTPSAHIGTTVTITTAISNAGSSYLIHWLNRGIEFSATTVPSVTYTKAAGIDTITARVVPTSYGCWDSTTSAGAIVMVSTEGITSPNLSKGGEELVIYPNPVTDVLHIDGNTSLSSGEGRGEVYKLLTIIGTVMQQGSLKQGNNSISLLSLPKGMYILEITNEAGGKMIRKIIKQ